MKNRFNSIDGLRGLCALALIPFHFSTLNLGIYHFETSRVIVNQLYLGVQFFFVLSGFLILNSTIKHFEIEKQVLPQFYIRRFFRIYPLWLVLVLASLVVWSYYGWGQLLSHITFTFGLFLDYPSPIAQSWSLFVEECFYVFFPMVFFLVRTPLGAVVIFVITLVFHHWAEELLSLVYSTLSQAEISTSALANFHYILTGMICYHLFKTQLYRKIITRPLVRTCLGLILIAAISLRFTRVIQSYEFIIAALALALAMEQESLVARFLNNRFLRFCGKNCYAIYLFHPIVIFTVSPVLEPFHLDHQFGWPAESNFLFLIAYIPLVLLVSHLMTTTIENQGVSYGRHLISRLKGRSPQLKKV